MSRRRRGGYHGRQTPEVSKALRPGVKIQPQATFTAQQVMALAQASQAGPSIPDVRPLPRDPNWTVVPFGPSNPLFPQQLNVPRDGQRQAEPRQFEYPVSWNLPGFSDRLIPWSILRNAADIPLFRQCIELRKQEAVTKPWDIRLSENAVRRAKAASPGQSYADIKDALEKKVQPEIGRLIDFWQEPDRWNGHDFTAWMTKLLEDQFVLDAISVYPRWRKDGKLFGFEVIDGTTIKPLLDDYGRRPLPPNPAYQQILYGFPRGEFVADTDLDTGHLAHEETDKYTADQMVYLPWHTRTFTPYGHSSVERALQDGDLWMRRHGWLKAEYTDGVMPSGWLEAGEAQAEWTPTQLATFEMAFNDYYAGATASRQRFRILPWGMKPSKETDLGERYKPDYDMFLLKLVVRHFDTTSTELGFLEHGRGSSGMAGAGGGFHEGQAELQERTSTQPTLARLGRMLTRLQIRFLGAPPELEFVYPVDEQDEQTKEDTMWNVRVQQGRVTRNEDRDRMGMPRFEFEEADMPAISQGSALLFIEGAAQSAIPGQPFNGQPAPGMMPPPQIPPPGVTGPSSTQPPEPGTSGFPAGGPGGGNVPGPPGGPGGALGAPNAPSGPGGTLPAIPPPPEAAPPPATIPGAPGLGGEDEQQALTKADIDWLRSQSNLAQPGASGLEVVQEVLQEGIEKLQAAATGLTEDESTELRQYGKWRRNLSTGRVRGGTFLFHHVTPDHAAMHGVPIDAPVQYLIKAQEPDLTKDLAAAGGSAAPAGYGGGGFGGVFQPDLHPRGGPTNRGEFTDANNPKPQTLGPQGAGAAGGGGGGAVAGSPANMAPGGGAGGMAAVSVADVHGLNSGTLPGHPNSAADMHPAMQMSPQMAATQRRNELLASRNQMLAQRLQIEHQNQVDRQARENAANQARWAREAAANARKQAAEARAAAIQGAKNYATGVNTGLDAAAGAAGGNDAGYGTSGTASGVGYSEDPQFTFEQVADIIKAEWPDMTWDETVDMVKVWDPALHPRGYHGKFAPVGVRRPAFNPQGQRWGRSEAEIHAWEQARAAGGKTAIAHVGVGVARVPDADNDAKGQVGPGRAPVNPLALHAAENDSAVRALMAGRNAKELKVLAAQVGAGLPGRPGLRGQKDAIIDAVRQGRERRGGPADFGPQQRQQVQVAANMAEAARVPMRGQVEPRAPGVRGIDRHHGYNDNQNAAVDAAKNLRRDPNRALDIFRALSTNDFHNLEPEHRELIRDRLVGLHNDVDVRVAERAALQGPRFDANPHMKLPPNAAAAEVRQAQRAQGAAAEARKASDPVLHARARLDEAGKDAKMLDKAMVGLNTQQHHDLGKLEGVNPQPEHEPQRIRDMIIGNRIGNLKKQEFIAKGIHPNEAGNLAMIAAGRRLRELRQPPEPLMLAQRGGRRTGVGFDTIHHKLDNAHGNRAAIMDAIHGLKKADVAAVAKQRGLVVGDGRQRKDDLQLKFLHEEAFARHQEDALGAGMDFAHAGQFALGEANKVRDAHQQVQQMDRELKQQAKARKAAAQVGAVKGLAQLMREAGHPAAIPQHGTGVTHDTDGYAIHNEAGNAPKGLIKEADRAAAAVPPEHVGLGAAGDRIRAGQAGLAKHLETGVVSRRAPEDQGAIGETHIVTHGDGGMSVHKYTSDGFYDGQDSAKAEELGAHLAIHMGLNAPVVRADPTDPRAVDMEFKNGYKTANRMGITERGNDWRKIGASPVGRKIALLDAMIGNSDRHTGNWMIPDGKNGHVLDPENPDIVLIDHGFSFPRSDEAMSEGAFPTDSAILGQGLQRESPWVGNLGHFGILNRTNNYTAKEIDVARTALQNMKPEFDRMDKQEWYNLALIRLGEIARRSTDPAAKVLSFHA